MRGNDILHILILAYMVSLASPYLSAFFYFLFSRVRWNALAYQPQHKMEMCMDSTENK